MPTESTTTLTHPWGGGPRPKKFMSNTCVRVCTKPPFLSFVRSFGGLLVRGDRDPGHQVGHLTTRKLGQHGRVLHPSEDPNQGRRIRKTKRTLFQKSRRRRTYTRLCPRAFALEGGGAVALAVALQVKARGASLLRDSETMSAFRRESELERTRTDRTDAPTPARSPHLADSIDLQVGLAFHS